MIDFIEGRLEAATPGRVTINIGCIGLQLFMPLNQFGRLPSLGKEVKLFTHLVWKDTGPQLFGFYEAADVTLFEQLITVSGVGPRTALALIGHLERGRLASAIACEDIALLSKAPGLGRKTAQRLCIELKERVEDYATSAIPVAGQAAHDALAALVNLGYSTNDAQQRVARAVKASPDADVAALISTALKE